MRIFLFLWFALLFTGWVYAADEVDVTQEEIALNYYMPIAEGGEPLAQLTLGEMYFVGQEVRKDLIAAYAWLAVAAHQGVHEAATLLADVKREMSAEQLEAADQLAKDFIANYAPPAE